MLKEGEATKSVSVLIILYLANKYLGKINPVWGNDERRA